MIKNNFHKWKNIKKQSILFLVVVLVCAGGVIAFLNIYFAAYQNPYMEKQVIDLSANWQYHTGDNQLQDIDNLKSGPWLQGGKTITLYKTMDVSITEAAILVRANHQTINLYLDDVPFFINEYAPNKTPGMALHYILLPSAYLNKTLTLEITSPYSLYAGRTSTVLLGTIPSLEAYTLSHSMRSVVLMAMCLLLGLSALALTMIQAIHGALWPETFALGIFAIMWALYYVCTEYIAFQFFTPSEMSMLSLGLYFSFPIPLVLFFYFSFKHYKKMLLPAVILHSGFVLTTFVLQLFNIVQLPQLININNIFLTGLLYTLILTVLEAIKKNRPMMIATPFLMIAYLSMLYNFVVFYGRFGVVPYSYKDTYFLLILSILVYKVQQLFSQHYRGQREAEVLSLQNQLVLQNYEQIKTHLEQMGGLKHEIQNHLAAIQIYLQDGRYLEAQSYVVKYTEQVGAITVAAYHEHFLINAVVGNMIRKSEQAGINVELNLKPCHVGIAEPELYSLLTNILNNAVESCVTLPKGENRFIRLSVARREPYLHIICANSKTGKTIVTDGKIKTTKSDTNNHGYGLWTITRIVNFYDGIMDTEYDENTFTITVALKD